MQQSVLSDLNEIVAFVALADAGSFAAAGRLLDRDPTVISRRLSTMEARLGIRLAQRSTRKVALTEAGEAYLARVRPLLRELYAAGSEAVAFAGGEPRGHLRISLPGTFGSLWLAPLIVDFMAEHPLITIEADSNLRFVDLIAERYDLVIRLGALSDSRLLARKVANRRRIVCASPEFIVKSRPITVPSDLENMPCLCNTGRTHAHRWSFTNKSGTTADITVTGRLASNDPQLLAAAAAKGLGVLYTTDWYVGHQLASGKLVELLPEWTIKDPGGVFVVTPAASGMASKTRAFSDWLAERLASPPWERQADRGRQRTR